MIFVQVRSALYRLYSGFFILVGVKADNCTQVVAQGVDAMFFGMTVMQNKEITTVTTTALSGFQVIATIVRR